MENQTYEKEITLELAKLIQGEVCSVEEILRLTKELEESLHRDDRVSVQMLLEMRKDEMDKVDSLQKKVEVLLDSCPLDIKAKLEQAIHGAGSEADSAEINRVMVMMQSVKKTISQAQAIDKVMSIKLAGEDSFYAQTKNE